MSLTQQEPHRRLIPETTPLMPAFQEVHVDMMRKLSLVNCKRTIPSQCCKAHGGNKIQNNETHFTIVTKATTPWLFKNCLSSPLPSNSHLTIYKKFADDFLIFPETSLNSVNVIKKVFKEFANLSGLKANPEKSTVFCSGVSIQMKQQLLECSQRKEGQFLVCYQGVPSISTRLSAADCSVLLDKISKTKLLAESILGSPRSRPLWADFNCLRRSLKPLNKNKLSLYYLRRSRKIY